MVRFGILALGLFGLAVGSGANAQTLRLEPSGANDASRLQSALDTMSRRGGGTVSLNAGVFRIASPVAMPSNVTLSGQGCGRTVIRRAPQSRGQMMFRFDGVRNVRVNDIRFSYEGGPQYYRAIGFRGRGSQGIDIRRNCFDNNGPREGPGDRWAIELSATESASSDLTIVGNDVKGNLQLTAGGGRGVIRAVIADNTITDGWANAIALSTLADKAVFRDILIEGNVIRRARSIGIYIGPDKPSAGGGTFQDIRIRGNRIEGLQSRFGYGVMLRAPRQGFRRVSISHNVFDGGDILKKTTIRLMDDHSKGTREFSDVTICANDARNFSRGVWFASVSGANVYGNTIRTGRPYLVDGQTNRGVTLREGSGRTFC